MRPGGEGILNDNIIFPALEFTEVGVYTYKVKEIEAKHQNWIPDKREYTVVITVKDTGEGKLEARVSYPDGNIKFCNVYHNPCNKRKDIDICQTFMCLPFPMYWFMPLQRQEFMQLMESDPHLFEKWERILASLDNTCSCDKCCNKEK